MILQARDLEKNIHRKRQDEKSANWLITNAKEADLDIDEELQYELHEKLGKKAKNVDILKNSKFNEF
jgi:hypothetical protein